MKLLPHESVTYVDANTCEYCQVFENVSRRHLAGNKSRFFRTVHELQEETTFKYESLDNWTM